MSTKIIVLKEGFIPDKSVFNDKGKTYILTTENETIPVSVLGIVKGEFEIVFAENGSRESYAFYLGQLYVQNKNAKIYTNDETLRALFEGEVKADKPVRKVKKAEPVVEKAAAPVEKTEAPAPAPAKRGRKPKQENTAPATSIKGALSSIKKEEIEKLLKKNSFDLKYVPSIMDALSTANEVTADILVRTKVSLIEDDKEIIAKLGELIKTTYC